MSKRSAEEIIQAVERYNTFGPEGFQHTKNQQYSSELKQRRSPRLSQRSRQPDKYLQKVQDSYKHTVAELDQGV